MEIIYQYCGMCSVAKGQFIGMKELRLELLVLLPLVSIYQEVLLWHCCALCTDSTVLSTELHTAVSSPNTKTTAV